MLIRRSNVIVLGLLLFPTTAVAEPGSGDTQVASASGSAGTLPAEILDDPLGGPLVPPSDLARWLAPPSGTRPTDALPPPAFETVAKPLEDFVKTPWQAPAFAAPTRPGILVRQEGKLPWGIDAEWRVGLAVDAKGPGRGEFADASQWTIRKAIADDFLVYLHDRGSGFVKTFGERLSVFGRYITTGDRSNPVSSVQFGAAKSY